MEFWMIYQIGICLLQELQMSMLAALYLDADQVRQMFIQRLRDPLECEQLKLAIIELVTASIPKQPGMTEAFFKMNAAGIDKSTNKSVNEGIGSFLVEYLNTFLTVRNLCVLAQKHTE